MHSKYLFPIDFKYSLLHKDKRTIPQHRKKTPHLTLEKENPRLELTQEKKEKDPPMRSSFALSHCHIIDCFFSYILEKPLPMQSSLTSLFIGFHIAPSCYENTTFLESNLLTFYNIPPLLIFFDTFTYILDPFTFLCNATSYPFLWGVSHSPSSPCFCKLHMDSHLPSFQNSLNSTSSNAPLACLRNLDSTMIIQNTNVLLCSFNSISPPNLTRFMSKL